MQCVVITPPAAVVSIDLAKQHLQVDGDDDNLLISALIGAATGRIDGPDGLLGRAIGKQTLEASTEGFGHGAIYLPCPPVISVDSIKYDDIAGLERTLDPAAYEFAHGVVAPVWGKSWPSTRANCGARGSVRITYQAGYDGTPKAIVAGILLMVGDLYRYRETVAMGTLSKIPMSTTVEALLEQSRLYS